MRGRLLLSGCGGGQGGLEVDRLVEQLVADQDHQGKEAQLEVAVGYMRGESQV